MKRRVAALEQRIPGARSPRVIIITGGLPSPDGDPDPKFATAGDAARWERRPLETFAEFHARVTTATAATARHIIFGGLPDEPVETDFASATRRGAP